MWMSAHMRRGDFALVGWVMEKTVEAHFERIRARLDSGRGILKKLHKPGVAQGVETSQSVLPKEGDPLVYLQSSHAILF